MGRRKVAIFERTRTRGVHFEELSSLVAHLLKLALGKRGAEDLGLVVFEALDFGLPVLEAGLFGGEGSFFGDRKSVV